MIIKPLGRVFQFGSRIICLSIKKPRLVPRLIKASWNMIIRSYYFYTVTISPSFSCNLSCAHCYAESLKDPTKQQMTPEQVVSTLKKLYAYGIFHFEFQGGEPLLLHELSHYILACNPDSSIISITTNGSLLDEKMVSNLKKLKVDVIHISLDSFNPEEHDSFRGRKGLYQKVMDGAKLVRDAGIEQTFQITITHDNIYSDGVQNLFSYAIKNKIPIWIFVAQIAGKWADNRKLLLTEEDLQSLRKLHDQHPEIIQRDCWNWFGHYSCPAVKLNVIITAYGDVIPCPFIQISYGNLLNEDISTIYHRMMKNKFFKNHYPMCLSSENKEFMDTHIIPFCGMGRRPIDYSQIKSSDDNHIL